MTIYGRNGSPTVTLALPFSRVDVKADDALPAIAGLASLTARLARTVAASETTSATIAELAEIAGAAEALALEPYDQNATPMTTTTPSFLPISSTITSAVGRKVAKGRDRRPLPRRADERTTRTMRSAFAVVVSVAAGAIVLYTISSANGNVREATAIRVQLKAA